MKFCGYQIHETPKSRLLMTRLRDGRSEGEKGIWVPKQYTLNVVLKDLQFRQAKQIECEIPDWWIARERQRQEEANRRVAETRMSKPARKPVLKQGSLL